MYMLFYGRRSKKNIDRIKLQKLTTKIDSNINESNNNNNSDAQHVTMTHKYLNKHSPYWIWQILENQKEIINKKFSSATFSTGAWPFWSFFQWWSK